MNKTRFRLLVFFMSLSLIGIILVQLYWVNSSLKNSEEQFKFHIQQVLTKVSDKLDEQEADEFKKVYKNLKDSIGREPSRADLISLYGSNTKNKSGQGEENPLKGGIDITESGLRTDLLIKDFKDHNNIEGWLAVSKVRNIIDTELEGSGVNTPFEFGVYNKSKITKIKSGNLIFNPCVHEHPIFEDGDGASQYRLLVDFPNKRAYLFSSILGITLLSLVFTLIIIIAYLSAINQLVKQKNISEIKTDFINNMTHEFKTPIATINLALDAIRNPRIIDDKEKVQRYLQMIRDENKRMHAQVENVLQISKLDKKELDIDKEQADIHEVIEGAIEHVQLIIDERHGTLIQNLGAQRTTALLNDVHFTNVLVNILDNAIKYSPDEPIIEVSTENVKDFILIKIKDSGLGMSKQTQKRIFEKFYREHTGDVHNVKGHGLGLAYVKRIIDDHNCNIYVESEKGKGSTFIIKMPLIN